MFDESAEKENIGDFSGVTPARQAVPTPNTVIATPSRTPGMATPGRGNCSYSQNWLSNCILKARF